MKLYLFNKVMKVHSIFQLPAMTIKEIRVYKKILFHFRSSQPLRIFEYGSGYSTVYFGQFLKKHHFEFEIDSIDNNRSWHLVVDELIKKNKLEEHVNLYLEEFLPFWENPGWSWNQTPEFGKFAPSMPSEFNYINQPLNLGKKYDLIVIDARFRRRCLEIAKACLSEQGIVFLHDAQKEKYHQPLSLYRYTKFFNSGAYFPFEKMKHQFWLGSPNNRIVEQIAEQFT